MDDIESALPPLTQDDVENVMRKCLLRTRKSSFIHVGSKKALDLVRSILEDNDTPRNAIMREIEGLGIEKALCLMQVMLLGRFPTMSLNEACNHANKTDRVNIAGYLSEKRTLFRDLERGMKRLERRI